MGKPTYADAVLDAARTHGIVTRPAVTKHLAAAGLTQTSKIAKTLKLALQDGTLAAEGARFVLGPIGLASLPAPDEAAYVARMQAARADQRESAAESEKRKVRVERQYASNYKAAWCVPAKGGVRSNAAVALMSACPHFK